MVTMVWVVSRFRLKVPPGTSFPNISPLIPSGQRNCASWASQPQKSVTLPPQPGGGDHESSYKHVVALEKKKNLFVNWFTTALLTLHIDVLIVCMIPTFLRTELFHRFLNSMHTISYFYYCVSLFTYASVGTLFSFFIFYFLYSNISFCM